MKKKITKLLLFIWCFLTILPSWGADYLYYIENTEKEDIKNQLEKTFLQENYTISKKDPYYLISNKNTEDYAIIILQQSGSELYYYFTSSEDEALNRAVLKTLRYEKCKYHKLESTNLLANFSKMAKGVMTNTSSEKQYTFDDLQEKTVQKSDTALKGYVGKIAKGEEFTVYLRDSISTATTSRGDLITAVLPDDWVYNNHVIAPQGSLVFGLVTKAQNATYGFRNGYVQVDFYEIVTPEEKTLKIKTEKTDFKVDSEGQATQAAGKVLAGTAMGVLGGLLIAALSNDASVGMSTLVGAGVGAGTGLIAATAEKGVDAEIPAMTQITLILEKPLKFTFSE